MFGIDVWLSLCGPWTLANGRLRFEIVDILALHWVLTQLKFAVSSFQRM